MASCIKMKATGEKIIIHCSVVGDSSVGKTTLIQKFVQEESSVNRTPTVFDNFAGNVRLAGNEFTVSVFDTSGQHDLGGLRYFSYAQSEIVIVCYSVTDRTSFDNVSNFWIHEVKENSKKRVPIILVATHCDVTAKKGIFVTKNEGRLLATKIGAFNLVETSVYDLDNVSTLFESAVKIVVEKKKTFKGNCLEGEIANLLH